MARPHSTMPSRTLVLLLNACVPWFQQHALLLQAELGDENPTTEAPQIATDLDQAELDFARERKEDKEVTASRDALGDQVARFSRSLRASVERILRRHPRRDAILADFNFRPVRSLRAPQSGIDALHAITRALELHREVFSTHPSRDAWPVEAERLRAALSQSIEDAVRETLETRTTQQRRDALRLQALEIIDDLYSAAQAVDFQSPEPLASFKALIQTYASHT